MSKICLRRTIALGGMLVACSLTSAQVIPDIGSNGVLADATLAPGAALVTDTTRPGAGPGNLVLSTGPGGPGGAGAAALLSDDTPGGSFTMAAWFKTNEIGGFKQIFGRGFAGERIYSFANDPVASGEDLGFAISNTLDGADPGGFVFTVFDDPLGSTSDGQWHHTALVFDNATSDVTMYLDGGVLGTFNNGFTTLNNVSGANAAIGIGQRFDGADQLLNSYIDDAVYWRGALDANDIAAIASGTISALDVAAADQIAAYDMSPVPEPTAAILTLLGWLSIVVIRRR